MINGYSFWLAEKNVKWDESYRDLIGVKSGSSFVKIMAAFDTINSRQSSIVLSPKGNGYDWEIVVNTREHPQWHAIVNRNYVVSDYDLLLGIQGRSFYFVSDYYAREVNGDLVYNIFLTLDVYGTFGSYLWNGDSDYKVEMLQGHKREWTSYSKNKDFFYPDFYHNKGISMCDETCVHFDNKILKNVTEVGNNKNPYLIFFFSTARGHDSLLIGKTGVVNPDAELGRMNFKTLIQNQGFIKNNTTIVSGSTNYNLPYYIILVPYNEDYSNSNINAIGDLAGQLLGIDNDEARNNNFWTGIPLYFNNSSYPLLRNILALHPLAPSDNPDISFNGDENTRNGVKYLSTLTFGQGYELQSVQLIYLNSALETNKIMYIPSTIVSNVNGKRQLTGQILDDRIVDARRFIGLVPNLIGIETIEPMMDNSLHLPKNPYEGIYHSSGSNGRINSNLTTGNTSGTMQSILKLDGELTVKDLSDVGMSRSEIIRQEIIPHLKTGIHYERLYKGLNSNSVSIDWYDIYFNEENDETKNGIDIYGNVYINSDKSGYMYLVKPSRFKNKVSDNFNNSKLISVLGEWVVDTQSERNVPYGTSDYNRWIRENMNAINTGKENARNVYKQQKSNINSELALNIFGGIAQTVVGGTAGYLQASAIGAGVAKNAGKMASAQRWEAGSGVVGGIVTIAQSILQAQNRIKMARVQEENTIRSINASIQDARNRVSNVVAGTDNISYQLSSFSNPDMLYNYEYEIVGSDYQTVWNHRNKYGDSFHTYFVIKDLSDLMTHKLWNFVRLADITPYLKSKGLNDKVTSVLNTILTSGVTFWNSDKYDEMDYNEYNYDVILDGKEKW